MYLLGYSLDNLSLMALTLAVGFVVDDAIVMLENIVRHMEMGKPPHAGGDRRRARRSAFTIVSMTFSLAAVFIPILFMGGIIGKLFHEFAVTIGVAILVSGFVSLTLTPMLASRFLRATHAQEAGTVLPGHRARLRARAARRTSAASLGDGAPRATLVFSGVILVATVILFVVMPKGLFPSERHRAAARDDGGGAGRVVRRAHRCAAAASRRSSRRIRTCAR